MNNQMENDRNDKFEDEIRESYVSFSDEMPLPPSNAFARIMEKIDSEERQERSKQSVFEKMTEFLREITTVPKMGWALAGVQFAVILFIFISPLSDKDMNNFQTLSINTQQDKGIEVNIVFKEDALLKDIQQLMQNSGAVIINGPTDNGLYILQVKEGHDLEIRLETIGNAKIVKFMSKRY